VGGPDEGEVPVHPDHEDRGTRTIPVDSGVLVESADLPAHGERVWLKGYGCVRHTRDAFEYTGADIGVVRDGDVPVVHWAPADGSVPVLMRTMGGDVTGYAEPGVTEYEPDDVLQFERVGFVRVDAAGRQTEGSVRTYFAHR